MLSNEMNMYLNDFSFCVWYELKIFSIWQNTSKFNVVTNEFTSTLHAQSLMHLMMSWRKNFVMIIIASDDVSQYNIMQIYEFFYCIDGLSLWNWQKKNSPNKLSDIDQWNPLLDRILCQTYKFNVINRIKWSGDSQANLLSWIPM